MKSLYLHNASTDLDEIWIGDASWFSGLLNIIMTVYLEEACICYL